MKLLMTVQPVRKNYFDFFYHRRITKTVNPPQMNTKKSRYACARDIIRWRLQQDEYVKGDVDHYSAD